MKKVIIGDDSELFGNYIFIFCNNLQYITIGNRVKIYGIKIFEPSVKFVNMGKDVANPVHYFENLRNYFGSFKSLKKYNKFNCQTCPISQEDFNDDTDVVSISCGHIFSKDYFDMCMDKYRCPVCRNIY